MTNTTEATDPVVEAARVLNCRPADIDDVAGDLIRSGQFTYRVVAPDELVVASRVEIVDLDPLPTRVNDSGQPEPFVPMGLAVPYAREFLEAHGLVDAAGADPVDEARAAVAASERHLNDVKTRRDAAQAALPRLDNELAAARSALVAAAAELDDVLGAATPQAADEEAAAVDVDGMLAGNVGDVMGALVDADRATVEAVLAAEQSGKARKSVVAAATDRLAELDGEGG